MASITYTDKDKTATDGIANKWRAEDANEVKAVVNQKDDKITVQESLETELTFDVHKKYPTTTGGSHALTLSADGHNDDVVIVMKFNTPDAVTFPAGAEPVPGSEEDIDSSKFNLITLIYQEDWDGNGGDKVLYNIQYFDAI